MKYIKFCLYIALLACVVAWAPFGLLQKSSTSIPINRNNSIVIYSLFAEGNSTTAQFTFEVPGNYLRATEKNRLTLIAAYPGMESNNGTNSSRFFQPNGVTSDDVVTIYIETFLEEGPAYLAFRNRNDAGRSIFENELKDSASWKKIDTGIDIQNPENVAEYANPNNKGFRRFIITTDDGRVGYVECALLVNCKGVTTWNGAFRIEYRFSQPTLGNMVDLDKAVVELIENFNPRPL